ncbi:MAG: multicomponent Na+:H+ antiporter subunit [Thermotogaceae bacterium]|jgi:multicomponent Na+:H+ antiporter subunit C|nr:multicomponent Na+:H+ antiporter subunit [Thermotogaceae bacterium]
MSQYLYIALMFVGIYGLLSQKNILKMIISLNIMELGLNLFIISTGYIKEAKAPIILFGNEGNYVDPLPQAIVLTAIVIGLGVTAVALMLARNIYKTYGTYEIDEIRGENDD